MSFLLEPAGRPRDLAEGARAVAAGPPGRRWKEYARLGWLDDAAGLLTARPAGSGRGLLAIASLIEELGRTLQPDAHVEAAVAVAALGSAGAGLPPAAGRVLSSALAGESLVLWCGPSDVWNADPADRAGDGPRLLPSAAGYRLRGRARAVVDAADADHLVVAAQAPDGAWRHVLTPAGAAGAAGVRIQPLASMDVTRRYADIWFDAVEVDPGSVVDSAAGEEVERAFEIATVLQCAESIGVAGRSMEMTLDYTSQRVAFGRTVASYQAVKHRLATMYLHLEAGRAVTVAAAGGGAPEPAPRPAQEPGPGPGPEPAPGLAPEPVSWLASAAKAYVADIACELVEESMQLHGGVAFTWDCDLHLRLRRVRTNRMRFGSPAAHRAHIAREVGIRTQPIGR